MTGRAAWPGGAVAWASRARVHTRGLAAPDYYLGSNLGRGVKPRTHVLSRPEGSNHHWGAMRPHTPSPPCLAPARLLGAPLALPSLNDCMWARGEARRIHGSGAFGRPRSLARPKTMPTRHPFHSRGASYNNASPNARAARCAHFLLFSTPRGRGVMCAAECTPRCGNQHCTLTDRHGRRANAGPLLHQPCAWAVCPVLMAGADCTGILCIRGKAFLMPGWSCIGAGPSRSNPPCRRLLLYG